MSRDERVIIAMANTAARKEIAYLLNQAGYIIIDEAEDGISALKKIRNTEPDLVILDLDLPTLNGIDVITAFDNDSNIAFLLICPFEKKDLVVELKDHTTCTYIIKPYSLDDFRTYLEIALLKTRQIRELKDEIRKLREELELQKLISRAKAILMKTRNMSEAEAHRWIQKQSMVKRVSKKKIAEMIIMSADILV